MVNTGCDQVRAVCDLINPENQKENPDDICAQPSTQGRIDTVLSGSMSRGLPDCAIAPPPFTVEGAFPKSETEVVIVFSRLVDPVTVRNRKNYSFDPPVKVTRARSDPAEKYKEIGSASCRERVCQYV